MLAFADVAAATPLVVATAGASAAKYLPIMYNGTQYKIELRLAA